MADGKWVMTEDDARRVDLSFSGSVNGSIRNLPNYGRHRYVDDREGEAKRVCAFCGSSRLESGFGGYGEGFGYKTFKCAECGASTDFVYKDDEGKLL